MQREQKLPLKTPLIYQAPSIATSEMYLLWVEYNVCYNCRLDAPGRRSFYHLDLNRSSNDAVRLNGHSWNVSIELARNVQFLALNRILICTEHSLVVKDELTLLEGIRRLDQAALEQVHDTYYPVIFRYISFRVGDHQAAEDLTSEVFARLLSAVRDQSAPRNTLRGWLYGVASRVVADYHRKGYKQQHVALTPAIQSSAPDPSETFSTKQTLEALYEAMTELTEDQQEVIALRFGYEMPIREVARTMGKSEGAIKQLQARAVAALARILSTRSSLP